MKLIFTFLIVPIVCAPNIKTYSLDRFFVPADLPATNRSIKAIPVPKDRKDEEVVFGGDYKDTNGKLYLRTFFWTGPYGNTLEISWIYLGNAGSIIKNPAHGVNPVDFHAELTDNAANIGKYKINGNKLYINWSNGKTSIWNLETKNGQYSAIDGGIVSRVDPLPAKYTLSGQYAGGTVLPHVSSIQTFNFNKDGTFTLTGSGTVVTRDVANLAQVSNKGAYSITGNTLRLNFDNGKKEVANILIWDMGGGKKNLVINTTSFPQEKL